MMRTRGRPSLGFDHGVRVTYPASVDAALRQMAADTGIAQRSLVRGLLVAGLQEAGYLTDEVSAPTLTPAGGAYRG